MFDILEAIVQCPRCTDRSPKEIRLLFGSKDGLRYRMGDKLRWVDPLGPPAALERHERKGSTNCPRCQLNFLVNIHFVSDLFVAVEPHKEKKSYLED